MESGVGEGVMAYLVLGLLGLAAYGLGSIPTGYVLCRWLGGFDIRERGSGSTGATNVLRNLGKGPALVTLLVDIFKGSLAVVLLRDGGPTLLGQFSPALGVDPAWLAAVGAIAALVGHSCPVWLGWRGGKSVATGLGVLLAMAWPVALAAAGAFGGAIALSRIVSISSMTAAVVMMIAMVMLQQPLPYLLFGLVGGGYVIWRHRTNIQRLLAGTEPRLGQKLEAQAVEGSEDGV